MAGADDSGAAKEKSTNELPITKVENVQNNARIIYYRSVSPLNVV